MGGQPIRRLEATDNLSEFHSGVDALDHWFQRFAFSDQRSGTSVTYVSTTDSNVVGFYTVAPHAIQPVGASPRLSYGQPSHRPIPVILLARLAVHRELHGRGLGRTLLRDALMRSVAGAREIGGRAIVVHAKNDRGGDFYRRFGFDPMPDNPNHLYVLMKDVRRSIAEVE